MGTRLSRHPPCFVLVAGEGSLSEPGTPCLPTGHRLGPRPARQQTWGQRLWDWGSGFVRGRRPHGTGSESPGQVAATLSMLPCVTVGSLREPVSSGSRFPLGASSSLEGTVKRQAGPTDGWARPTSEDAPFRKAECLLGLHLSAVRTSAVPEAQWAELEVTSPGHSCGLCEPWEHAQAEGHPGTSGSLASHLCLSALSSSACSVDTWPRLPGHLLLFLLGRQPFPRCRADSRGGTPTCNRPRPWCSPASQAPSGSPHWLRRKSGGQPSTAAGSSAFPALPCASVSSSVKRE